MIKQSNQKSNLLIVDDSTVNLFLLEAQLKDEYNIISATCGNEAIDKAQAFPQPDIILLDIIMPDMNGYEVCSQLKLEPKTSSIPIIFITSEDEADKETYGLRLGASDYITRPFNIEIVKSRINIHLDLKKNQEALEAAILQLKEKETYLETIMATIQNGVIISDPQTHQIIDVNPFFCHMIGTKRKELLGKDYRNFLGSGEIFDDNDSNENCYRDHSLLKTSGSEIIHTRRWFKTARLRDRDILVQSLSDITNIKELLKTQDINIMQAKNIMKIIHNQPERNVNLDNNLNLFINYCSCPCHKEGGDHLFVKTLSSKANSSGKTFMSIKDQSGHEVGCILRSITTDLIHHAIIHNHPTRTLDQMITELNKELIKSNAFSLEEFFTSINIMIDHKTSTMHFVSTGHPEFFLIRDKKVYFMGKPGDDGTNLPIPMPDCQYEKGIHSIKAGDRYIFFTDGMMDAPMKSGSKAIKQNEVREQLETLAQNGHHDISEIMIHFMDWISQKSSGLFKQTLSDNSEPTFINQTGDDISLLWFEVESTDTAIEHHIYPKSIQEIDDFIQKFHNEVITQCKGKDFQVSRHKFRTALAEMILNAWKHGNKKDPSKKITLRIRYANDIHLEVIDEGAGFNYSNLPNPTERDNILKISGRGIFMTRYAANEVFWKDNGRHITAIFRRRFDPLKNEVANLNNIHLWK
jgi:PAS domain S-box-containing protein